MQINKYILLIIVHLTFLFSRDIAYTLDNGKRQMGIFQPRIYGLKNNLEISSHPLIFFIKPNLKIKKFHKEVNGVGLGSRFSIDYPTPMLKIFQKDGIGGLLSNSNDVGKDIPHLLVLQGEILATRIFPKYSITTKFGISTSLGKELDSLYLIAYDLAYPRMAVYHYGIGSNSGIDFDYFYSKKILFKADIDIFFLPKEKIFIEHKLLCQYNLQKYTIAVGYKYSYGHYPFNKEGLWNLFPLIDINWAWDK